MGFRRHVGNGENVTHGEVRNLGVVVRLVVVAVYVLAFFVGGKKSANRDGRARGGHRGGTKRTKGCRHRDGNRFARRVNHLRSNGSLPNQVIQAEFVRGQQFAHLIGGFERVTGRSNRLMRFLRILDFGLVRTGLRGNRRLTVKGNRLRTSGRNGLSRKRNRVGSHVRDVAVLVETLCDSHRVARSETQLATSLLLQRRGRERCRRSTRVGLGLDGGHGRGRYFESLGELSGRRLVKNCRRRGQLPGVIKVAAGGELSVGQLGHLHPERFTLLGHHRCDDIPIRRCGERLAFTFTLDDQAQCW
ncbi:unannotated protein [freshwater metagenome]|uniref:Unannotated protein n=1 Tax=freshwater metagenome TaxID=449393 RepID=A0A6J7DM95_9ZZZZ